MALNSGTAWRSAKNAHPYIAANSSTKPTVSAHWNVHQLWRCTESEAPPERDPSDDLHEQGHRSPYQSSATAGPPQFSALTTPSTSRWTQRACQRLCPRLQARRCKITGTSTPSMSCTNKDIDHLVRALQLRNLHSFLLCHDPAPVVEQQQASSTLTKNCTCGISPVFCSLHCGQTSQRSNWSVQHFDNELDLGHLHVHVWLGLLELVADDRRDVHNRKEPARPTRPPPPPPSPAVTSPTTPVSPWWRGHTTHWHLDRLSSTSTE